MKPALLTLTLLLATTVAGGAWASPRILSQYSGGGVNYYYNPSSSGGSNGYSGPNTSITRQHRGGVNLNNSWFNGSNSRVVLAAPCGNFHRAAARCKAQTMAWDPSLRKQRGW